MPNVNDVVCILKGDYAGYHGTVTAIDEGDEIPLTVTINGAKAQPQHLAPHEVRKV